MPFNFISTSFFIHSWYGGIVTEEALHKAGEAMGLPFLICSITVPFIGVTVDKYGKRAYVMVTSAVVALFAFLLFIFFNPIYGLILFGLSFSIFASVVWPAITLVVPIQFIGLALGLTTSMQNTSVSLLPLVVAYIFSATKSYPQTLLFFIFTSSLAIFISIVIFTMDRKYDNVLNRSDPENAKLPQEPGFSKSSLKEII